jgi:WhiB family redox-sensing transcriptional regulator
MSRLGSWFVTPELGWSSTTQTRQACDGWLGQLKPPEWARDALCREYPEVSFFPASGQPTKPAKAVCRRCAVINKCLAYALADASLVGVWGGTTERDRHEYRRRLESRNEPEPSPPFTIERARRVASHPSVLEVDTRSGHEHR